MTHRGTGNVSLLVRGAADGEHRALECWAGQGSRFAIGDQRWVINVGRINRVTDLLDSVTSPDIGSRKMSGKRWAGESPASGGLAGTRWSVVRIYRLAGYSRIPDNFDFPDIDGAPRSKSDIAFRVSTGTSVSPGWETDTDRPRRITSEIVLTSLRRFCTAPISVCGPGRSRTARSRIE